MFFYHQNTGTDRIGNIVLNNQQTEQYDIVM